MLFFGVLFFRRGGPNVACRCSFFFQRSRRWVGVAGCVVSPARLGDWSSCHLSYAVRCAAATNTDRPRARLEVAGAFLARRSIGHVPCDVQARVRVVTPRIVDTCFSTNPSRRCDCRDLVFGNLPFGLLLNYFLDFKKSYFCHLLPLESFSAKWGPLHGWHLSSLFRRLHEVFL